MPAQFRRKFVVAQTKVISSLSFLYVLENRSLAYENAVPTELNLGKVGDRVLPLYFSPFISRLKSQTIDPRQIIYPAIDQLIPYNELTHASDLRIHHSDAPLACHQSLMAVAVKLCAAPPRRHE